MSNAHSLFSDFPHIQLLLQLSARLPTFPIDQLSLHDFLSIPFRNLILPLPNSTTSLPTLKLLVSNVYHWLPRFHRLSLTYATRSRKAIARVLEAVEQGTMTLHSTLQLYIITRNALNSTHSLPDLSSWCLPPTTCSYSSRSTPIAVTKAGPGHLRTFWRLTTSSSNNATSIMPSHWKRFWRLRIPHGSRTIWWRLLHQHISTTQHMNRLMPIFVTFLVLGPEPALWINFALFACALPLSVSIHHKTIRHMFLDCPLKRVFWVDALILIQAPSSVTPELAWQAILLQPQPTSSFSFVYQDRLGLILQTIWAMHWRCILQEIPWNHTATYEYLESLIARHPSLVPSFQIENLEFILG
ncbi:predicted protein [Lichtheimia corymbifera JMRC:FSU:9682]|uniref:Reverse transcriptase zinc-binding domain-containing protein n=1 Tax=Lichtheimia corymbifera JMRC:FSU:9682 TaxID=1263082 RepID=A0A068S0L3_9FUNG|nr:predicted protein [Lichtheimia corymbifera JMRC:FSU:9682]